VDPPAYVADGEHGNLRGIWLEEGDGVTVENCDVTVESLNAAVSQGAIVVNNQFGRATIRDTSIRTDVSVPALRIQRPTTEYDEEAIPSMDGLPEDWTVTCEDLELSGDGDSGVAIHLRDRDGCRFEDVAIDQRAGTRHGLLVDDAVGTEITGGRWVTSGYPAIIGGEAESTSDDVLVCLRDVDDIRSTRFSGRTLKATRQGGDGRRVCLPAPMVEDRTHSPYEPYVGLTGMADRMPEGKRIIANYDGAEIETR
jgi:hypothetical protein